MKFLLILIMVFGVIMITTYIIAMLTGTHKHLIIFRVTLLLLILLLIITWIVSIVLHQHFLLLLILAVIFILLYIFS